MRTAHDQIKINDKGSDMMHKNHIPAFAPEIMAENRYLQIVLARNRALKAQGYLTVGGKTTQSLKQELTLLHMKGGKEDASRK